MDAKYQEALRLYKQGTYEGYQKAYELFLTLGDYEDSEAYLTKASVLMVTPTPKPTPTPTPKVTAVPRQPSVELQKALKKILGTGQWSWNGP